MSKRTDFVGLSAFIARLWDDSQPSFRPRARRVSTRRYWPHLHGRMRLTWPRGDIGSDMSIITEDTPLPHDLPSFGADWPAIRERVIERLRERNPDHPWVQEASE